MNAIEVQNLGKCYTIGHEVQQDTLRDALAAGAKGFWKNFRNRRRTTEDFWALQDVSFSIEPGEVVGVIGRNGAGKSTLLKLLSRITEPTTGKISLRGRIASLLEVGTGFHPELSGRENIFLNGAILGMRREEIRSKFDEIVDFAEVERFLDTPVKRYSSGMYIRLAFAVAAHLEPEILIVDEVLAVGDSAFQAKCLGKMRDVANNSGRTVLLVSHNLATIRQLCSSTVILSQGRLQARLPAAEGVAKYLEQELGDAPAFEVVSGDGVDLMAAGFHQVGKNAVTNTLLFGGAYELRISTGNGLRGLQITPWIQIHDSIGTLVGSICGPEEGQDFYAADQHITLVGHIPTLSLMPGRYYLSVQLFSLAAKAHVDAQRILSFEVAAANLGNSTRAYRPDHGLVRICQSVSVEKT